MRLFHVSEESNIEVFEPRIPLRNDMDKSVGLVWAINEECLPNFLFPRDCPRVCYRIGENSAKEDIDAYFTYDNIKHTIIIEHEWYKCVADATLYLYEFSVDGFELQDSVAGYYVAKTTQTPIAKYEINDLFDELMKRNVEIRMVDNLFDIAEKIKNSSLLWSLCRMKNARPKSI